MFWAFAVMVPSALLIGRAGGHARGEPGRTEVVDLLHRLDRDAGIRVGRHLHRASGLFHRGHLALAGGKRLDRGAHAVPRLRPKSAMEDGINFWNFTLPVMTIALYGMGYIARMTRASMAEVMTAQYIRTARLKGVSFRNIVVKHALQERADRALHRHHAAVPLALTGVVIVETLFNYNGFGWTLVQARSNNDIELLLACSIVAVFVVLVTQLISDIGYVFLNPRIRIA
jgi:peptide/nickel transport system permease protein